MHFHIFELEILVLLFKIFYIRTVTQIFFWCFFLSFILFFLFLAEEISVVVTMYIAVDENTLLRSEVLLQNLTGFSRPL